ncbi:hypothetical protein [Lederbergia lenta]|uniref:hypothetical protein n=1 Tax=Lederbergia lenta TaxID=1467 RepID=UPI00203E6E43|nr:hypothetical protein [Lederbergia lenta]MCM3109973.1 hypothetical protein [Lederbergia lenta]
MKEKAKEVGYAITKGAIGSVPIAGGVLSELFSAVFNEPATKRKEQVIYDIENRLQYLEKEGVNLEELKENEEFLSIAMQAYNIAMRTHQVDKRAALMNSIFNTSRLLIDENEKLMFLNYIDQFTEWHLRILSFLNDPRLAFEGKQLPNYYMGGKATVLEYAYPELENRRTFYDQVVKDLYSRGLIIHESLHVTVTGNSMLGSSTSETGKKFIEFITIK